MSPFPLAFPVKKRLVSNPGSRAFKSERPDRHLFALGAATTTANTTTTTTTTTTTNTNNKDVNNPPPSAINSKESPGKPRALYI